MVRVIGGLAAAALAVPPAMVYPDHRIVAAGALAGLLCVTGVLLASLGLATAGAMLALLVFAVALMATSPGAAVPEAVTMGLALLIVLDLTHYRQHVRGAWIGPGVLRAHLAGLCTSAAITVACAAVALFSAVALLPAVPNAMLRPVLAAVGGLLAYAAAVWAFARCR